MGATFQRWKTKHDMKADVEVIVGTLSHSATVLFNKPFLWWHIVGPQQSCSFLQYGPRASGATCGSLIHHPSSANTSCQKKKSMTHFLQIFTFLPLPPALNHLLIEFPSCAETSKLFVRRVRYSNHLRGSSQRPSRPLMFIMSVSLSSALQRCAVCFYKGVRIWMGAWVLVWCSGEEGSRTKYAFH